MEKDLIDIIAFLDERDFRHMITFKYQPWFGLAFAYHKEGIIGNVEYSKIREPMSDSDRDWEIYDERLEEFKDMAFVDLSPKIKEYLNNLNK